MLTAKKDEKSNFFLISIIVGVLLVLTVSIAMREKSRVLNGNVLITFIINGSVWLYLFIREIRKRAYSLVMIQWLFCLMFFWFAPMAQYFANRFPWIIARSDEILVRTNLVLSVWTISVLFGEAFGNKKARLFSKRKAINNFENQFTGKTNIIFEQTNRLDKLLPYLTAINIIVMIVYLYQIGLVNLMLRLTKTGISFSETGTVSMMIANMLQAICYFSVVISADRFLKDVRKFVFLLINGVLLVITYFPTGLARYAIGVIYLGIMLTFFKNWRNNRSFMLVFIMAFLIFLPFFNAFRTGVAGNINLIESLSNSVSNISKNLTNYDYDAYTYLSLTLEYVDKYGFGKNHILTVIFFFIPRAVWPNKALAGGGVVARSNGLFDNVSFPFSALGYMDMGVWGVILIGILVGYAIKKMDNLFWNGLDMSGKTTRAYDYLYNVFLIYFFFLCRGDLHYIWPYAFCYILTWYIIVKASYIKIFNFE